MGIFIKRRQGIEYLYVLAGRSQYFLGRKDDLDNLNLKNLHKAVKIIDGNFDKILAKYLKDLHEHAKLMSDAERRDYVSRRISSLDAMIGKFENTR